MAKRQHSVRKMVTFEPDFWKQINDFRFENRISTETEAVRILIERGLASLPKKA